MEAVGQEEVLHKVAHLTRSMVKVARVTVKVALGLVDKPTAANERNYTLRYFLFIGAIASSVSVMLNFKSILL